MRDYDWLILSKKPAVVVDKISGALEVRNSLFLPYRVRSNIIQYGWIWIHPFNPSIHPVLKKKEDEYWLSLLLFFFLSNSMSSDLAIVYAALILKDDNVEVTVRIKFSQIIIKLSFMDKISFTAPNAHFSRTYIHTRTYNVN